MSDDAFEDVRGLGLGLNFSRSTPFWGDDPDAWDQVVIANVGLPGLAEVEGDVELRVDLKEAPGNKGARHTLLGWKPAEVNITLRIWTAAQWSLWLTLAKQLRPNTGRGGSNNPAPVEIYHPALEALDIRKVTIVKLGFPKPVGGPGTGERTISLKALEFRYDAGSASTPKTAEQSYGDQVISRQKDIDGNETLATVSRQDALSAALTKGFQVGNNSRLSHDWGKPPQPAQPEAPSKSKSLRDPADKTR